MRAIETTVRISDRRRLHLDEDLPADSVGTVRVIILIPDSDDPSEREWLAAAATNPALDDLADPSEDVYTLQDGEPFVDAR